MKKTISATIDEQLIKWIKEQLKDPHKFRNKSLLIEIALLDLKNKKR